MTQLRTPTLIIVTGCLIGFLSFGPRSSLGFFLQPISQENGWGRDVLSITIALQNLWWGIGQPFVGGIADRYGSLRVFWAGAVLYALGICCMALPLNPLAMHLLSGTLVGLGLAGISFNLVLSVFGKLLPSTMHPFAFGAGTAASSFGQVIFAPLSVGLMALFGWKGALFSFAAIILLTIPLAVILATNPTDGTVVGDKAKANQSVSQVLSRAFRYPSYVLLVLGFFTCGFQLAFVTAHFPSYLNDIKVGNIAVWGTLTVGAISMLLIGLFNVMGSLGAGWLMARMPKRWLLAWIYFGRASIVLILMLLPASPFSAILFSIVMGFLWLSTVPPTSSLVAQMFGTRNMAMLYGFAFFSHQVGGFLGVLLGGIFYEQFGTYNIVWWSGIFFAVVSGILNIPIKEKAADEVEGVKA